MQITNSIEYSMNIITNDNEKIISEFVVWMSDLKILSNSVLNRKKLLIFRNIGNSTSLTVNTLLILHIINSSIS